MMKMEWCCHENAKDWGLLVLRVIVGVIFIYHGWGKLTNIDQVVGFFAAESIPLPVFFAYVVGLSEFLGGIGVLLGAWTRLSAAVLGIVMIFALLIVHIGGPFSGSELPLALLGAAAALKTVGGGKYVLMKSECICKPMKK